MREGQTFTGHVALDGLLRHAWDVLPVIGSREAAREVRELHPVGVLSVSDVNINRVKHAGSLFPIPPGLGKNAFDRTGRQIFLRVRNSHISWLFCVLELDMASCLVRLVPAFPLQPLDNFRAVHVFYYTQKYTLVHKNTHKYTKTTVYFEQKKARPAAGWLWAAADQLEEEICIGSM